MRDTRTERLLRITPDARALNFDHHAAIIRLFARPGATVVEIQAQHPLPRETAQVIAQQGAQHTILTGDPLPHAPDNPDLVILDHVLSGLRAADQGWFVRRLIGCLAPGGAIAIFDRIQTAGPHAPILQALSHALHRDIGQPPDATLAALMAHHLTTPLPQDLVSAWSLDAHVTRWARLIDRASWIITR